MNGTKAVLDTNVLIYFSKELLDFDTFYEKYTEMYVSSITYMEAFGYKFISPFEKEAIINIVKPFEIVHTDSEIMELVINYRISKKIKISDAIILATAKKLDAELVTNDLLDFTNIDEDVKIVNPFKI
ncbi:MAG: PIN domain-containing protein [Bacteroidetes bacterium]|nr:PIN domain-containing protein [Bacteroidota bacterium]